MDFEDLVCRVNLFPCIYCFSKFGIYYFRENGPFSLVSYLLKMRENVTSNNYLETLGGFEGSILPEVI